jgi:superfamily II DNA/RNA helicase
MFKDLNLIKSLKSTLNTLGFDQPTPIQARAVPLLLEGHSVVGVAQTGTGKTLAFVLPILDILKRLENDGRPITQDARPRAAVIVPSRELGEQVAKVFKMFTHETRLRVRLATGGTSLGATRKNLKGQFEVLVATPGRLQQLIDQDSVSFKDIRVLIFDEVDQMFDPSFVSDAKAIFSSCDVAPQMGLFSATVSAKVQELMGELFSHAEVIRIKQESLVVPRLTTKLLNVKNGVRFPYLKSELDQTTKGGTLVFVNTREQCDQVASQLKEIGRECVIYRGEMDKKVRRANLKDFRDGKVSLLISTDLASRGLDVDRVSRVINYHLPRSLENYIHRVGRTARAGREGLVVNLVTERDGPLIESLSAQ